MGTGGTITGVARFLKEKNPAIRIIGADPQGSIFAEMFRTGRKPQPQPYKVEGIGQDEMPGNVDFSVIDEIHAVSDKDSFLRTRLLARTEGIFAGGSAGAALHVALKMCESLTENDVVVIIIPDSGTRYLSKIYNDNWMKENQFLEASGSCARPARLYETRCAGRRSWFRYRWESRWRCRESDARARHLAGAGDRRR